MPESLLKSTESLRQKALEAARQHKASWIQLGQYLFTIGKDKLYRDWGFLTFEAYCIKEIGIKQSTAAKLLKSYSFLEKEEPRLTSFRPEDGDMPPKRIPNYESVNLLRLAKENKNISPREFSGLREAVLEAGKEPKEVRAQVKSLLSQHPENFSREEREIQHRTKIRRLIGFLRGIDKDFSAEHILPDYLSRQLRDLVAKLEDQVRE